MKHLTNAASPDSDSHHRSESLSPQIKMLGETPAMIARKQVEAELEHTRLLFAEAQKIDHIGIFEYFAVIVRHAVFLGAPHPLALEFASH